MLFIEEGNSDVTQENKINWQKRTLLYTVLQQILEVQSYCRFLLKFTETEMKESFLRRVSRAEEVTEAEMQNMSLQIEPRITALERSKKTSKPAALSLKAMRAAIAAVGAGLK